MKTFEEALQILQSLPPQGEEPSTNLAGVDEPDLVEAIGLGKHLSIAKEIEASEQAWDFVHVYVASVGPKVGYSVSALAMSMFVNGVIIGMEMERVELPEPE